MKWEPRTLDLSFTLTDGKATVPVRHKGTAPDLFGEGRGAVVEECIVMDHSVVGAGARLRRAILDRYNVIANGETLGFDPLRDAQRFQVDPSGIVVLPRGETRYTS